MVQVQGDSMINAGIFDSDMLIVRQQDTADNRDIVVALLDDSVTVKDLFSKKKILYVYNRKTIPWHPFNVKELQILGKVVGLYRNY